MYVKIRETERLFAASMVYSQRLTSSWTNACTHRPFIAAKRVESITLPTKLNDRPRYYACLTMLSDSKRSRTVSTCQAHDRHGIVSYGRISV